MKICYITTIPFPIRFFFIQQLQYLSANGFDVFVICSDDQRIASELGNEIHYIPVDMPRGTSFLKSIKVICKLGSIFKREQFDLIQYSTPNAAFYASVAAKAVGCRVRNYHLMGLRYIGAKGIEQQILKVFERITCKLSTAIECVSKSNLEMGLRDKIFDAGKAAVVWNGSSGGVNLRKFDYQKRQQWRHEIREELELKEEDFIYGFVGRINRDKGINELLEAFQSLNDGSKLLLVGPNESVGMLDTALLQCARTNPNVLFHDMVMDVERYFAAIDVLILPSYREGFGNVVIEAGAVGTPAIVSNIPGPVDTIEEGKTGLTVKVKDAKDLADRMRAIQKMDYVSMGERASRFAKEKFDSDILCERILERKKKLLK